MRYWLRFWLRYTAIWIVCTLGVFAFMASPHLIHGWPIPAEIKYGSPLVGLFCASVVMWAMEIGL